MKTTGSSLKLLVVGFALGILLFLPKSGLATGVTLTIDSSQSYLDLTGNAFGLNYAPQGAGSMHAAYSGSLSADLTAGVFTFSGGSSIVGIANPGGPYSSVPFPGGPWVGEYGVTATGNVPGFGISTINGMYINLIMDLTTGTAQNGAAPAGITQVWTSGSLPNGAANAGGPIAGGSSSLVGVSGSNTSAGLVSWNGTTLIIPVTLHTIGQNRNEFWSGQIVANTVPEPTTGLLLIFGSGLLFYNRRVLRR